MFMTESPATTVRQAVQQRLGWDPTQVYASLKRGWKLAAACLAACLTLAVVYLAASDRLYQATARLLVLQQGSRPLSVAGGDMGRLIEGGDDFLPTHAVVIRSPLVVSQAIESVGLRNLPTLRKAQENGKDPVALAIDRLSVSRPDRLAKVLRVDYMAGDRKEAIRTVRAITEAYRRFLDDNYKRNSNEVVKLISKARDELKGELEAMEEQYLEFRLEHSVLSTDETGRSFLTRRLDHWDRAANEAMVREVHLRTQLALGKKLMEAGSGLWSVAYALSQLGGGEAGSGLVSYAAGVSQTNSTEFVRHLSQKQQELAEGYGPQYAKVREIQEQIGRVQERMRDSRNRLDRVESKDLIGSIDESLKAVDRMRDEIASRFKDDLVLAKAAEKDVMIEAKLKLGVERQQALFSSVVDQLKQAQLIGDFTSISAQTIEAADGPKRPVRPQVLLTLALAVILGSALGVSAVLGLERLDARIRTPEEMRKVLGYPVLGQIPQLPKGATELAREVGLVSHTMPRSPSSEAYKMVRTKLEQIRRSRPVQVVLVTSPNSGDGKSVTASNLGITLAHAGRRVLLVDADLRRPTQDWIHKLPRQRGLVHVLRDLLPVRSVVQQSAVENLDVVTAGPEVTGPSELLATGCLPAFLESVRQSYDVVIIDSPPVLAVTDASIIGHLVDGVILVVRDDTMRHRDAERVVEMLETMGAPVLGTVLNRTSVEKSAYSYGYNLESTPGDGAGLAAGVSAEANGQGDGEARANGRHAATGAGASSGDDLDEIIP